MDLYTCEKGGNRRLEMHVIKTLFAWISVAPTPLSPVPIPQDPHRLTIHHQSCSFKPTGIQLGVNIAQPPRPDKPSRKHTYNSTFITIGPRVFNALWAQNVATNLRWQLRDLEVRNRRPCELSPYPGVLSLGGSTNQGGVEDFDLIVVDSSTRGMLTLITDPPTVDLSWFRPEMQCV